MKLKPGKYVQRDGGIATVAAVDETRTDYNVVIGRDSTGERHGWYSNGSVFGDDEEDNCDLIHEYHEPREFWKLGGVFHSSLQEAQYFAKKYGYSVRDILHLREVIE